MALTANGTTTLVVDPGQDYVLSLAGTFGSGTVTPKWSDGTTDVTVVGPSGDLAITAGAAYVITSPSSILKLVLSGATNPNINFTLAQKR